MLLRTVFRTSSPVFIYLFVFYENVNVLTPRRPLIRFFVRTFEFNSTARVLVNLFLEKFDTLCCV